MQIFSNTHYDFIKWRWHAIVLSALVILAGVGMIVQRGLPLGIDFSGGTIVVYKFNTAVGEDAVRRAIACQRQRRKLKFVFLKICMARWTAPVPAGVPTEPPRRAPWK